ncbi:MAG: YwqJ-related putative deaminase [Bryobacteraceae bacterium]
MPSRVSPCAKGKVPPEHHEVVQKILDDIDPKDRSVGHGKCVEPQCYSRALHDKRSLQGAKVQVKKVRKEGNPEHGDDLTACKSCKILSEKLGVTDMAKE